MARKIIPQKCRSSRTGIALVVADPEQIDVEAFIMDGIDVFLGLRAAIDTTWHRYLHLQGEHVNAEDGDEQALRAVLMQLVVDADRCGAREVFLGHPHPSSYEFVVDGVQYDGVVSDSVYTAFVERVRRGKTHYAFAEDYWISEISTTLTKNEFQPVIFVSWKVRRATPRLLEKQEHTGRRVSGIVHDQTEVNFEVIEGSGGLPGDADEQISGEEKPDQQKTCLLVEDDAGFARILQRVLERNGFEVSWARHGQAALSKLACENSPALVVCDIHMPVMSGDAFLRRVRSIGYRTPIIMLTSDEDSLIEAELVAIGADAFVHKQDDVRVLLAWCENLLNRESQRRRNVC